MRIPCFLLHSPPNRYLRSTEEFSINNVALSTLYLYVGLFFGALFWGISADVVGRRFSWNSTLLLSGVIGVAAGGVQSFNSWCGVVALLGFAVGGNRELRDRYRPSINLNV